MRGISGENECESVMAVSCSLKMSKGVRRSGKCPLQVHHK